MKLSRMFEFAMSFCLVVGLFGCSGSDAPPANPAPGSPSISIAGGTAYTTTTSITLTLGASDASEMFVTNTGGCESGGTWEAYASSKSWTLSQANSTATVYAKFKTSKGVESTCVSNSIIHDTIIPTVSSVTASTANGTYAVSGSIAIQAVFSESVIVTGTPTLTLETGTTDRAASYSSGSGSDTLVFTYSVQSGDAATDLDYVATSSLAASGGSITDPAGNSATLTLPSPGATGSLSANMTLAVDTRGKISVGRKHACRRSSAGTIKCWGGNTNGELGKGHTNAIGDGASEMGNSLAPVSLGTGRTAVQVSAGYHSTCAILDNGTVKCWGLNASGQLGQGTTNDIGDGPNEMGDILTAVSLGTGRTANQVAMYAYSSHVCALLDNGTVKCWGYGGEGQLGQGNTTDIGNGPNEMGDSLSAINLGTGRTAVQVAVGLYHSCAVLDNGTAKCWGSGSFGDLGQGNTTDIGNGPNEMGDNLPAIDLGTGRTATQITAGERYTCALLDNGTVKCWGQNGSGELGQGSPQTLGDGPNEMGDNLSSLNLGVGKTATQVTASYNNSCALLNDGTVKCWGNNSYGQLGQGNANVYINSLQAIDLGTGRTAAHVWAGAYFICAVLDYTNVKCWGLNDSGQLGQGNTLSLGDGANEMGDNLLAIDFGSGRFLNVPSHPTLPRDYNPDEILGSD